MSVFACSGSSSSSSSSGEYFAGELRKREFGEVRSQQSSAKKQRTAAGITTSANWKRLRTKSALIFKGSTQKTTSMRPIYWKEAIPSKISEISIHLYPNLKWEKEWLRRGSEKSYEMYVRARAIKKGLILPVANVLYFSDLERDTLAVNADLGILKNQGKRFKEGNYITVLSPEGTLYSCKKFATHFGRIQHSSLLGGKPVLFAGWMSFDGMGELVELSNFSGHYHSDHPQVWNMLRHLKKIGMDIDHLKIVYSRNGKAQEYKKYDLADWLHKFGYSF